MDSFYNFSVGDTVQVSGKSANPWKESYEKYVGRIYTIKSIDDYGPFYPTPLAELSDEFGRHCPVNFYLDELRLVSANNSNDDSDFNMDVSGSIESLL